MLKNSSILNENIMLLFNANTGRKAHILLSLIDRLAKIDASLENKLFNI